MSVARRTLVLLILLLGLGAPAAIASPDQATPTTVAAAPTADTTADTLDTSNGADLTCAKPGVQRPNCGTKPEQAGDRGGALQYTVWALLVIGLAIVFTVVFRSAKRTNDAKVAEVGDRNWS